jgi:TolB protein
VRRHNRFLVPVTLVVLALLAAVPRIEAQDDADIHGTIRGGGQTIKIALPSPQVPEHQAAVDEIVQAIRDDLSYSGWFEVVDPGLYRLVPPADEKGEPFEAWESIGVDDGFVRFDVQVDDGRVDLAARLYDVKSQSLIRHWRYAGSLELKRRVAHTVSDELVLNYTGKKGVAMTRIAFVSKHGDGKEVYLMDYDGARVRRLTTSGTINLSPAWSPDGTELAWVSWHDRHPGVYLMNTEGELLHLPTVGGDLSSAPDWSPDGTKMAYTSDIDDNTEIYLLDRTSGKNTRLTRHPGIDTAPAVSPNGREIAFTSDRTGRPHIYLMGIDGLDVRRISWDGTYNESPAWSPDGTKLAYVSRIEGVFQIMMLDNATKKTTRLTYGLGNNENPRWSPDGRHIVFASNRGDGRYAIYTMRSDGSNVQQLTKGLDAYTPDWSR